MKNKEKNLITVNVKRGDKMFIAKIARFESDTKIANISTIEDRDIPPLLDRVAELLKSIKFPGGANV